MEENQEKVRTLIVDTNVLIASLIRTKGVTRVAFLLLANNPSNRVICPETVVREIKLHEGEIARRLHVNQKALAIGIEEMLKNIEVIKEEEFRDFILQAKGLVKDEKDSPFVGLALKYSPSVIVTYNEKHYKKNDLDKIGISVVKPIEALKLTGFDTVDIRVKSRRKHGIFSTIARTILRRNLGK